MPCSRKIGSSSLFTDFYLSEDSGIISYIKKKQECRMDKLKFKKLEVIIL